MACKLHGCCYFVCRAVGPAPSILQLLGIAAWLFLCVAALPGSPALLPSFSARLLHPSRCVALCGALCSAVLPCTADPTAIEAEVRKQMAERAAAHEDRNLARMLTPAERK